MLRLSRWLLRFFRTTPGTCRDCGVKVGQTETQCEKCWEEWQW